MHIIKNYKAGLRSFERCFPLYAKYLCLLKVTHHFYAFQFLVLLHRKVTDYPRYFAVVQLFRVYKAKLTLIMLYTKVANTMILGLFTLDMPQNAGYTLQAVF